MIETEGLTGAETLLRVLSHMGVDRIFSSPGSEWSPVWEAFAKAKAQSEGVPQYISSRHEEVAVGMASGYAKSTGKLPAVMIHTTVGALHATMALRGALHEQIPMVVFTGESLGFGEEAGPDVGAQWLGALADIGGPARLVDRCVKWSYGVNAKSLLPSTIQRACQLAMGTPKGPVFVSLPMEYLFDKMTKNAAAENVPIPAPTADAAAIEELAALLANAKNPIIITEEAGRDPGVVEQLVELAELLGAGVVESRASSYVNFPRTHHLHAGFEPQEFLQEADAILLLGVVAPWHPASKKLNPGTKVAVLSDNPLRSELPYWGFPVNQILTGEIKSSMKHLLEIIKKRVAKDNGDAARRAESWRGRHEARRASWQEDAVRRKEQKPIDTRWVTYELAQVIPADAIVVEETITHRLSIHRYLDMLKPGTFFAGCIRRPRHWHRHRSRRQSGESRAARSVPDRRRRIQLRPRTRRPRSLPGAQFADHDRALQQLRVSLAKIRRAAFFPGRLCRQESRLHRHLDQPESRLCDDRPRLRGLRRKSRRARRSTRRTAARTQSSRRRTASAHRHSLGESGRDE
jgi:acetolactate synthase-1/2/3 large subunit